MTAIAKLPLWKPVYTFILGEMSISSTWVRPCNAGDTGPGSMLLTAEYSFGSHLSREQRLHTVEDLQVSFMLGKDSLQWLKNVLAMLA